VDRKREARNHQMSELEKRTVYAAMMIKNKSQYILGLFSSKEKAMNKCLSEHSYSRFGWEKDNFEDSWSNGLGLHVLIKKFDIE